MIVVDLKTGDSATSPTARTAATTRYPTWSPTGEWIVWGSNKDRSGATGFGATDLWRIRPDGTGAQKIVDGAGLGNHNFESARRPARRGLAPDPEPTREELRPVATRGRPRTPAPRARTVDARRPRLQARRRRRRDRRLRLGPRRRRRLRRRRRRAAARDVPRRGHLLRRRAGDRRRRAASRRRPPRSTVTNAAPAISGARVNDGDPASFTATVTDPGVAGRPDREGRLGRRLRRPRPCRSSRTATATSCRPTPGPGATREARPCPTATAARPTATATRVLAPANGAPSRRRDATASRQGETVDVDLPGHRPRGRPARVRDRRRAGARPVSMRAIDPLAPEQPGGDLRRRREYTGADTFTYRVSDGDGQLRARPP